MTTLRRAVGPAVWALRTYAWPAVWLAMAGAVALAVALPVMAGATRLGFATVRAADIGIEWTSLVIPPPVTQHRAVTELSGLLVDLAVTVLVAAAVTIVALSFARASARRTEMAVRRAVGATRRDLRTATLIEGLVLVAIATCLGTPVGIVGARLAVAAWPGTAATGPLGPALVAVTGIAGVILGGALLSALSAAARRRRISPSAAPQGLIVPALQLGISLAVLVAAAQLRRSADAVAGATAASQGGGDVYQVAGSSPRLGDRAEQYRSLLGVLAAEHGFEVVSLTSAGTLVGLGTEDLIVTDCGRCSLGGLPFPLHPVRATLHAVSPDTFRALDVPVVAGRPFATADDWRAARTAVVNETLAARHFEHGRALGRKIYVGHTGWYTVIGVVRDRTGVGFGAALLPRYAVYLSVMQQPPDAVELLVRPRPQGLPGDAALLSRAPLDVAVGLTSLGTEASMRAAEAAPIRWFGRLFALEGAAAFLIALLGSVAVMRMWVQGALPELGARRAVGAKRIHVLGFVLARAVAAGVAGVLIGLWLGIMVSGLLGTVVGGLPHRTPGVVAWPAVALVLAAIAGALAPAWAAARASPVDLLRAGE